MALLVLVFEENEFLSRWDGVPDVDVWGESSPDIEVSELLGRGESAEAEVSK